MASSGSSHGVMAISSGTQQKEQKTSAEFCGFTFIILSQIICHDYITLYVYIYHIYIYNHIYIYHIVLGCDILGPFGLISWKKSYTLPLLPSLCASESLSSCQSHCNCSSTTAKEDHILLEPRRNPLRFLPTGVNSGSGNGNG